MTTSAGRFKSTISKGSHKRSIVLLRPIATPSTVPNTIASAKDAATRASVTARFKNKAPDHASVAMTDTTASGDGSVPGDANANPVAKRASNRSSGISRIKKALVRPGRQAGYRLYSKSPHQVPLPDRRDPRRRSWRGRDRESARRRLPLRPCAGVCHRYSFVGRGRAVRFSPIPICRAMFSQSASE